MAMPSYHELKEKFVQICEMNESAHSIALGAAIGILIGFQPCMGIQMTIAIPLAFILRANKLLAAAGVWFTNPVTFIPIYYSAYVTGIWLYPVESLSLNEFTELMNNFSTKMLMQLGEKTIIPLVIGCLVLGFISAALTYFLVLFMVKKTRKTTDELHHENCDNEQPDVHCDNEQPEHLSEEKHDNRDEIKNRDSLKDQDAA